MPAQSIHIKLPAPHMRLLNKLQETTGLDRTSVIRLAIYELAVKYGLKFEYGKDSHD